MGNLASGGPLAPVASRAQSKCSTSDGAGRPGVGAPPIRDTIQAQREAEAPPIRLGFKLLDNCRPPALNLI